MPAADPELRAHVFAGLRSNAPTHSGTARAVAVGVEATADGAPIAARDPGIGNPPDVIPPLFARTLRARTAEGIAGTGTGLQLERILVEVHGGHVAGASEIGVDSIFTGATATTRTRAVAAGATALNAPIVAGRAAIRALQKPHFSLNPSPPQPGRNPF